MKPDKVLVACPKCGHTQLEPRAAYSTNCKQCREYFRVQDVLRPAAPPPEPPREGRHILCFKCGKELIVPLIAQSAMCKHCGSHVDLHDYIIHQAIAKNFKTKGRLVVEDDGYLFNTDTIAGEVIIKGKFLGKLTAETSLEIRPAAEFKGTFQAARLILPAGTCHRWPDTLNVVSAEIGGELIANVRADKTVVLKSTARYFGQMSAGGLVVESGAVFVGTATIGV